MIKASDLVAKGVTSPVVDHREYLLKDLKHKLAKLVNGSRPFIKYFNDEETVTMMDLEMLNGILDDSPDWGVVRHYDRDTNKLMALTIALATPIEEAEPIEAPVKPTASKKKKTSKS
jgi:hypothetical protein